MNKQGAQLLLDEVVPALRSGNYTQGKGRLRDDEDNMCCLGVMCDVLLPGEWKYNPQQDVWYVQENSAALPYSLSQLLGVDTYGADSEFRDAAEIFAPQFSDVSRASFSLTAMNDGYAPYIGDDDEAVGETIPSVGFDVIADVIEHAAQAVLAR